MVEVVGARPIGQASAAERQQQHDVGGLGESGSRTSGDRNQRDLKAPGIGDDIGEFAGFAGIREGEDRIVGSDHAEIAVARFDGVNELRRGAGRGKCRRDLAGDMTAFADPRDDDPSLYRGAGIDGVLEPSAERFR